MPKIFTTPEAEAKAKAQMRYTLIAGGLQTQKANETLPHSFSYNQYFSPCCAFYIRWFFIWYGRLFNFIYATSCYCLI